MPDWSVGGGSGGGGLPIPVPVADGGTGATTPADARTNLGLGQVIPQGLGLPTISNIVGIGHSWMAGTNNFVVSWLIGQPWIVDALKA